MAARLQLGEVSVDVVLKNIKHIHLSVHPPNGSVRISAPVRMSLETIRVFAISKLEWIKQKQERLRKQERETPREYLDRESHNVWGKRYLLSVVERDQAPSVELKHDTMVLTVRAGTGKASREAIVSLWYREQLRAAAPALIAKWASILGVSVNRVFVQRMKTRWGTCNTRAHTIRLNSELAKKPVECLDYIVLHEMAHLIERSHNDRFKGLLDHYMPQWRHHRAALNRLPVRHESWAY